MKPTSLYAVILAGGSGTRFWPLSRERFPKQLLHLIGEETLIQQTVRRALKFVPGHHICVVANHFQAESIKLQLSEWNHELAENFIVEPEGRNTAPAIGLAALRLIRHDPAATMLVFPADHVMPGEATLKDAISLGCQLAQEEKLVTFGIQPTKPETGYGYIQANGRIQLGKRGTVSGYPVTRFVEKPDLQNAQRYVRSGKYYWNSGIFVWRAATVLEEFARYQPVLLRGLQAIDDMMEAGTFGIQCAARYAALPSVSIDYGIMEPSTQAAVVPVDCSWSDVGSWTSVDDLSPRDTRGNIKTGNVVDLESTNTIFLAGRRLVGAIGLSDMIVVDTPDATLVCPKARSQDVKVLVEELKRRGAPEHLEHVTIHRPWGSYTILEEGVGYKIKRLSVLPKSRLSLQSHNKRSEHWVVIAGTARVTCGETVSDCGPGESTMIPVQTKHRLENPGTVSLEMVEVQYGPYLGEDDIVRYQDEYGRSKKP